MTTPAHPSAPLPSDNPCGWALDSSYRTLPPPFYSDCPPTPVARPALFCLNQPLAAELGLDLSSLSHDQLAPLFTGNQLPPGARPIAQAYAGHQFGHFTMLGDGRAILLGEQITPDHQRFDLQFKGSGPTPYSRRGDGRAALGPMLREYLISEAMHALGIPTTRSLAVAVTGEQVHRDTPLPGAILTRVAASHLRVGTFQFAAATGDPQLLQHLTTYTIQRHAPAAAHTDCPARALLEITIERQAALIAQWMLIGFVHGVMNTDNMAIAGETIDYGPCAFLDTYDPATVFSSIDHQGRYAYGNQPTIAQWNLARFAETLLPLLHPDRATAVEHATNLLHTFPARYHTHRTTSLCRKLGLTDPTSLEADPTLPDDLLNWMEAAQADFTNTFANLDTTPHTDDPAFLAWHQRWLRLLHQQQRPVTVSIQSMRRVNPVIIPRNHLVEEALQAATDQNDPAPFHTLVAALRDPFHPDHPPTLRSPAPPHQRVYQTFCGT